MSAVVGPLVDQVSLRVRNAPSRDFIRSGLSHMQRLINGKMGLVVTEETFTTVPWQVVYPISALASAPNVIRIVGVKQADRDLVMMKWTELWYIGRDWLRRTGPQLETYALVGRDVLILWPGVETAVSLTLVQAVLTDALENDGQTIQLPDDYVPLLLDMTEMLCLIAGRVWEPLKPLMDAVTTKLSGLH